MMTTYVVVLVHAVGSRTRDRERRGHHLKYTEANNPQEGAVRPELTMLVPRFFQHGPAGLLSGYSIRLCRLPQGMTRIERLSD
jgi:hypothetical protein